jgi:hypothetical protein
VATTLACPISLCRRVSRTVRVGVGAATEQYKCCATQNQARTKAHRGPAHLACDHCACEANLLMSPPPNPAQRMVH